MKKKLFILLVFVGAMLLFAGCAHQVDVDACVAGTKEYGFWNGLWHGIIAPIDLVGMFFRDDVSVYAPNNNGTWYALGFVIGSGGWGFMGGKASSRKNR